MSSPEAPSPPAAVPSNLSVASYFAAMEFFRCRFSSTRLDAAPFRVLSVDNGSPEYDADVVRQLATRVASLRYTILNASKAYSTMATKHADIMSFVEFVSTPLDSYAPLEKFDFVHTCLWRDATEREDTRPDGLCMEAALLRLCQPRGTLALFMHGENGVFALRPLLRLKLAGPSAVARVEASASARTVASALSAAGASAVSVQTVDSQVDLRECVSDVLSPIGVRTLSSVLKHDVEDVARRQPTVLEERVRKILTQPQAWHAGDVRASPEQGETCELVGVTRVQQARSLSTRSRTCAHGDTVLVLIDAISEMTLSPMKVSCGCPVYAPVVAVIALAPSAPSSAGAPAADAAAASLFAALQQPVPPRHAEEDVFYPHGVRGGFFNKGMQLWLERREALGVTRGAARRHQQPPLTAREAKSLVSDLAAQQDQRTFELPRPLRLPDIIKCYNLIWDMEEGYGD